MREVTTTWWKLGWLRPPSFRRALACAEAMGYTARVRRAWTYPPTHFLSLKTATIENAMSVQRMSGLAEFRPEEIEAARTAEGTPPTEALNTLTSETSASASKGSGNV